MLDLSQFCGTDTDTHSFSTPFSDGEYTYATDGFMMVRVPYIKGTERAAPVKLASSFFSPSANGAWQSIKGVPKPALKQCPQCKGTKFANECEDCEGIGEVSLDHGNWTYEVECKECDGEGFVPGGETTCSYCHGTGDVYADLYDSVRIEGTRLSLHLLDKIKPLPNIEIYLPAPSTGPAKGVVPFRFDGGDGIIMAMSE